MEEYEKNLKNFALDLPHYTVSTSENKMYFIHWGQVTTHKPSEQSTYVHTYVHGMMDKLERA